jgi:23S rRNA (uracil1939-C5)-methyltransferase
MSRSAKKPKFFENVTVIDIAEEGKGVGKAEDFVLFIEKAVPGDIADVEVYRSKKSFGEAKITQTSFTPSEYRVPAFCEHFGTCGGCKWQHMTYEAQLKFKQKAVHDALTRIAKIDVEHMDALFHHLPTATTATNWSTLSLTSAGCTTARTAKTKRLI